MHITFTGPGTELLDEYVTISEIYGNYTQAGNLSSYAVDIVCDLLNIHRTIKSKEVDVLESKLLQAANSLITKIEKFKENEKKEGRLNDAQSLNDELTELVKSLERILTHTIDIDDAIDFDALKDKRTYDKGVKDFFDKSEMPKFIRCNKNGMPDNIIKAPNPNSPADENVFTKKNFTLFQRWFSKEVIKQKYKSMLDEHNRSVLNAKDINEQRETLLKEYKAKYEQAKWKLESDKKNFVKKQTETNNQVDILKDAYFKTEKAGIEEYCLLVLENSEYPDILPKDFDVEYQSSGVLIVNFQLPSPEDLPQVDTYKYIKSRDELTKKAVTAATQKKRYESVNYQICIRTIHELFEADVIDCINTIVFNGLITRDNPATGINETKTIMSVSAAKEEFMVFDLSKIDPKATFKHLKGISAATLIDTAPVPPIAQFESMDKRFIDNKDVTQSLDISTNLAAMHWEDFEHLVRQLFEQEFMATGGEVRVTQASSDGGVDAIAYDPDPIRGGKIVIQAKRYTNTVGVAAVRELYGTLMNEGASKGVLVTTSDFGGDSLEFIKGKPITLINGSNLLSLLAKHGVNASINITEAKKLLK